MLCNFPLMILGNFFPRHAHKSTVMQIRWNQNGNWLLTASRDHLLKLFDIRMMKEMQTFRGHKREATGRNNVTFEIIHFMFFKHFSGTLDQSRLIHRGEKTVALVLSTVVFFHTDLLLPFVISCLSRRHPNPFPYTVIFW